MDLHDFLQVLVAAVPSAAVWAPYAWTEPNAKQARNVEITRWDLFM